VDEEWKQTIDGFLQPVLSELELELFELTVRRYRSTVIVEIIIDKKYGGISVDECTKVNRELKHYLEDTGLLGEDYSLEVSSPGLDRPLRSLKDFVRVTGRQVRFYLSEKVQDRLEYVGRITQVNEENEEIVLELANDTVKIPYAKINKAVQEIESI